VTGGIICVGHAAWDRVYRIERFPVKPTKLRALEYIESGGGTAANAAAAIGRLDGSVELWSRIGNDQDGHKIRHAIKRAGVDIRYVEAFDEGRSSLSAVVVDSRGERMVIGSQDSRMPTGTSWLPLERIGSARIVMADLKWTEAVRAIFARARQVDVPTVLDAEIGNRTSLTEILSFTDFAIFSEEALADYLPELEPRARLDRIMLLGPRHAGVTLGERGYMWQDTFGGGTCPAFKVDVVDTTGAGDTFHGAFALALSEQRPVKECARFACAAAALKCTGLGSRAALPSRQDVEALLKAHPA